MAIPRPTEDKRARRGLGARTADGKTTPAKPRGRMKGAPGGSRMTEAAGPGPRPKVRPHQARVAQARRRTVRDNPEGV
jgi:hypothetical protein